MTAFLFAAVIFIYSRSVHQTGAAKVSGGNIDTGKNNIKAGTVSNEVVNSDKGCEPENVAFTNLNTAFKADLSSLPAKSDTNGKTGPSPYWSFYEMEAFSNVWIGSQFINLPNPLNNDFIFELWFQVKSGYPSISFTVSDAGENYANYNFILDVWEASAPDFSFTEGWTKNNFYASTTRQFSDRTKIPACFLKNIKWSEINHLSIKRENATVKYYLNNYLLQAVQASVFPIKKISLAIASKSIVDVTNIEAKIQ